MQMFRQPRKIKIKWAGGSGTVSPTLTHVKRLETVTFEFAETQGEAIVFIPDDIHFEVTVESGQRVSDQSSVRLPGKGILLKVSAGTSSEIKRADSAADVPDCPYAVYVISPERAQAFAAASTPVMILDPP